MSVPRGLVMEENNTSERNNDEAIKLSAFEGLLEEIIENITLDICFEEHKALKESIKYDLFLDDYTPWTSIIHESRARDDYFFLSDFKAEEDFKKLVFNCPHCELSVRHNKLEETKGFTKHLEKCMRREPNRTAEQKSTKKKPKVAYESLSPDKQKELGKIKCLAPTRNGKLCMNSKKCKHHTPNET